MSTPPATYAITARDCIAIYALGLILGAAIAAAITHLTNGGDQE